MVFIWSQLTQGDANYTLVQVSVNDLIMIFAFAPIAALLLGVTDITVPWETLLLLKEPIYTRSMTIACHSCAGITVSRGQETWLPILFGAFQALV